MTDEPAFPSTEVTRHIGATGISARELAVLLFVAAEITRAGLGARPAAEVVADARKLADDVGR